MPDIKEPVVQPVGSPFNFPFSWPLVGGVVPGLARRYNVKTVNFPDGTQAVRHTKPVDPVKKFPQMEDEHSKGHPMIESLRKMLQSQGKPVMMPGYERVREDLSWRGQTAAPAAVPQQIPGV